MFIVFIVFRLGCVGPLRGGGGGGKFPEPLGKGNNGRKIYEPLRPRYTDLSGLTNKKNIYFMCVPSLNSKYKTQICKGKP